MRLLRLEYVPWFPFSTKWSNGNQIFSSHLEQLNPRQNRGKYGFQDTGQGNKGQRALRGGPWGEPLADQLAALRELPGPQ